MSDQGSAVETTATAERTGAPAEPLPARLIRFVDGPDAAALVLLLAGVLFVLYRLVDRAQGAIKSHGWVLAPAPDLAAVPGDLALYYGAGAAALAVYLLLVAIVLRNPMEGHGRSAVLALGVAIHLGVILTAPSLSLDALSYVAHGGIPLAVPGLTPYTGLSSLVIGSPIGDGLAALGWSPPPIHSPYGPLWTLIEIGVARSVPTVGFGVVAMKLIAVASTLGSAWLIWAIVGRTRPRLQLAATTLWLWNPVVLVELAGEGHNDGLMTLFALLAVYLTIRAWTDRAILALAAGTLVKWVPAILGLPLGVYLWRTARSRSALVFSALTGLVGAAVLAAAAFAPVWAGETTFLGLVESGTPGPWATLPGTFYRFLSERVPSADAALIGSLVPAGLFLVYLVVQSWRIRGPRTLLLATGFIAVAYLLLARGLYYPWYAILPIALLALTPTPRSIVVIVTLTVVARLVAPLIDMTPDAYPIAAAPYVLTNLGTFATLVVFGLAWATTPVEGIAEEDEHAVDGATSAYPADGSEPRPRDAADRTPAPAAVALAAAATTASAETVVEPAPPDAPEAPAARRAIQVGLPPALTRFVEATRSDAGPSSRLERLLLALLVLVPMAVTGWALLPEILVRVPSMNDDMLHWLFVQNATAALDRGANLLDHWMPQIETGFPQFLYYQHLAPLIVVALGKLTGGAVALFDLFNIVRWVLLVTFPLTVLWSMRRMGFSLPAAAVAAAASCLISGQSLYGFEYDSYIWRGWGLFTQLLAMHLSVVALATGYRAISTGKGIALAGIALGVLVLAHLIYAYMLGITLVAILLLGMRRATAGERLVRFALLGVVAALVSAYMWLPFLLSSQYLNATPYLQSYKYDGYGLGQSLGWLVSGQLLDFGRAPILTGLLALGVVAALAARRSIALVPLALFALWVLLWSGRATLGPLVDLMPLGKSLLFHRFVGAVDLFAIVLIGLGGGVAWRIVVGGRGREGLALAGLAIVLVLLPTLRERTDYYAQNAVWMQESATAVDSDTDAAAILAKIGTLPPGRVFAGLPTTWANEIKLGDIPFSALFQYRGMVALPPPSESMSLTSDLIWDFDASSATSYRLWNARYVVAPASWRGPDFLTPIMTAGRYALWEAPSGGYGEYVRIVDRSPVASQAGLLARNRPWASSTMPAQGLYAAYGFPSRSLEAAGPLLQMCGDGGKVADETAGPDRYAFRVSCTTESGFVIKTTYHPNWRVTVDGAPVETFMASPSYLGIALPAGDHEVVATYEATPMKMPLAIAGIVTLLLAALLGRWLERIPGLVVRAVGRLAGLLRRAIGAGRSGPKRRRKRVRRPTAAGVATATGSDASHAAPAGSAGSAPAPEATR